MPENNTGQGEDSSARDSGDHELRRRLNEARLVVWVLMIAIVVSLAIYAGLT